VTPKGDASDTFDPEQRTSRKTPPEGSRISASDIQQLTPAGERTTAHPGDLKEAVLPELRRLFTAEDYETVLPMAEALLSANPDDEVRAIVATCRSKLIDLYSAKLGRLSRVPLLKVQPNEWLTLDLDHRACFLLVHVDNVSSFEMILDTSGMLRHEAMRVLCDLLGRGIIAV
jgi:hypothetical protein